MTRSTSARRFRLLAGLMIFATPLAVALSQEAETPEAMLGRALHLEEVAGDLEAAIGLYERIVENFPDQRAVSARALVQMGSCYEKMGNMQARMAYERVLRDYADQRDNAAVARDRLAALEARDAAGVAAAAVASGSASTARDRELPEIKPSENGIEILLRMSPDNSRAMIMGVGGGQNLGVYDFASEATTWITDHSWDTPEVPMGFAGTWSADSTRVAYSAQSHRGDPATTVTEIYLVEPGETPRAIYRSEQNKPYVTDWLSDGSALVAAMQRPDQSVAIGLISVTDGSFRQLKTLDWARPGRPQVSPDGRYILFEDGTQDARDLFLAATDGSSLTPLDEHPALDSAPLWSPDGRHVIFRSNRQGMEGIWAVAVRAGAAVGDPFLVMDRADGVNLLDWTTGGIVYRKSGSVSDIYTTAIDPNTGATKRAPKMIPYPGTGANMQPHWSPDGSQLAFLSGESFGRTPKRTLVLMPLDGGRSLQFDPPEEAFYSVSNIRWRPDGKEISLNSRDRQNRPILLRLSLPEAEWAVEPLPEDLWYIYMDWAPSWQSFFYYRPPNFAAQISVSVDAPSGLYEVERGTGERRFLWDPPGPIRSIRTSPDGRYIGFTILSRLWMFDRTTGQARQIPGIKAVPGFAWSPDSRHVLYVGDDAPGTESAEGIQGDAKLRVLEVATGVSTDLQMPEITSSIAGSANPGAQRLMLRSPNWGPEGNEIGFVLQASSMETRILENPLAGTETTSATTSARR